MNDVAITPSFIDVIKMVNKVLAAFIGVDVRFAITGAILVGFSVIVKNTCFNPPTNGHEAARDLLYQQFPLTGEQRNTRMRKGVGKTLFKIIN